MAEVRLSPQAAQAYEQLEKSGSAALLDGVDEALSILAADPGDSRARRRAFAGGLWGISARDPDDDWLVVWEFDAEEIVRVRYLGPDPFRR